MNNIYDRVINPGLNSGWDKKGKRIDARIQGNVESHIWIRVRDCAWTFADWHDIWNRILDRIRNQVQDRIWIHVRDYINEQYL